MFSNGGWRTVSRPPFLFFRIGMSKITRYCKTDEEHIGENVFDCSRPNIFGNPYTHIRNKQTKALVVVKDREEAIRLYDPYFDAMMSSNDEFGTIFRAEFEKMYEAYRQYGEVFLGCYCKPYETCHCDIIRKKLLQRSMRDKLKGLRR